jgi:hypothetical protein
VTFPICPPLRSGQRSAPRRWGLPAPAPRAAGGLLPPRLRLPFAPFGCPCSSARPVGSLVRSALSLISFGRFVCASCARRVRDHPPRSRQRPPPPRPRWPIGLRQRVSSARCQLRYPRPPPRPRSSGAAPSPPVGAFICPSVLCARRVRELPRPPPRPRSSGAAPSPPVGAFY